MTIKRITQQRSLMGVFMVSFWLMTIGIIAGGILAGRFYLEPQIIIFPMILFFITFFVAYTTYSWLIGRSLKARNEELALLDAQHAIKAGYEPVSFAYSSLNAKEGDVVKRFSHMVRGQDWAYSDFSCDHLGRIKGNEYTERTIYYSVMTISLPRKMPHMFFDSVRARRRQFRMYFQEAQSQSLEGNFDQHFTTYFPAEYHIDGRSLISPEVMDALMQASDYDIEVVGNRVFLYGDLREPRAQVQDMLDKITLIKEKLLHNAPTYRDEALPYAEGRKSVTPLGAQLAVNLTLAYMRLVIGIAIIGLGIVSALTMEPPGNIILYLLLFGGIMAVRSLQKIIQEKRRRASALKLYNYGRAVNK